MLIYGWLRCEKSIVPPQQIYDIEFEKFTHAYAGTCICRIVTFTRTLWDDFFCRKCLQALTKLDVCTATLWINWCKDFCCPLYEN